MLNFPPRTHRQVRPDVMHVCSEGLFHHLLTASFYAIFAFLRTHADEEGHGSLSKCMLRVGTRLRVQLMSVCRESGDVSGLNVPKKALDLVVAKFVEQQSRDKKGKPKKGRAQDMEHLTLASFPVWAPCSEPCPHPWFALIPCLHLPAAAPSPCTCPSVIPRVHQCACGTVTAVTGDSMAWCSQVMPYVLPGLVDYELARINSEVGTARKKKVVKDPVPDIVRVWRLYNEFCIALKKPQQTADDVQRVRVLGQRLQELILHVFPQKNETPRGDPVTWDIPKFHDLKHMGETIVMFGATQVRACSPPEEAASILVAGVMSRIRKVNAV